jgi:hypothetical protein
MVALSHIAAVPKTMQALYDASAYDVRYHLPSLSYQLAQTLPRPRDLDLDR